MKKIYLIYAGLGLCFIGSAALVVKYGKLNEKRVRDEVLSADDPLKATRPVDGLRDDADPDRVIFFEKTSETLRPLQPEFTCAQREKLKADAGLPSESFWSDGNDFIYFDVNGRSINICHQGKMSASEFPLTDGLTSDEEAFSLRKSFLQDINQDGKPEFTVFHGHCVEGPCIGVNALYQLDGTRVTKLYSLAADLVHLSVKEDKLGALILEKFCYSHDFGVVLRYLAIAEFTGDREFQLVPAKDVNRRFPRALELLIQSNGIAGKPEIQRALEKIQTLIRQAYGGENVEELLKKYDAIVDALPREPSENEVADRLPVHCNPRKIIQIAAGQL